MHADAAQIAVVSDADARPKTIGKTRLKTLRSLDQRTTAARRAGALAKTFETELGELTPAQRVRVETAAMLSALAEDCTARRLAGDDSISLDDLVRAVSAARRAVRDLGIKPSKSPAPGATLGDLLRADLEEQRREAAAKASATAPTTDAPDDEEAADETITTDRREAAADHPESEVAA